MSSLQPTPAKKHKLSWTEIKKSIVGASPEYFYYPDKYLDSTDGGLVYSLIDPRGTVDSSYKITLDRNQDLSLLTMYLPINQLEYPEVLLKFWKQAIELPDLNTNSRQDISLTLMAKLDCYAFAVANEKGDLSSVKVNLEMPVKYVLNEEAYNDYAKAYNILDVSQTKFVKRRIFNLKGCLERFGRLIPFEPECSISDKSIFPFPLSLKLNRATSKISGIEGFITFDGMKGNYFYKAFEKEFDRFFILNGKVTKTNMFKHMFDRTLKHAIGLKTFRKMNELLFLAEVLGKYPETSIITNSRATRRRRRDQFIVIDVDNNNVPTGQITFYPGIFYTTTTSANVFKNTKIYKDNDSNFDISLKKTIAELEREYNLKQTEVDILENNVLNRMLCEIKIRSTFSVDISESPLDMNGLTVFLPIPFYAKTDAEVDTLLGPLFRLPTSFEENSKLFSHPAYANSVQFVDVIGQKNVFLQKNAVQNLTLKSKNLMSSYPSYTFSHPLNRRIPLDETVFRYVERFYEHNGSKPDNSNDVVASYICYSAQGRKTHFSVHNITTNILGYIYLNKQDVKFHSGIRAIPSVGQNAYSSAIQVDSPLNIRPTHKLDLQELEVYLRTFNNFPYNSMNFGIEYPLRNTLFIKNRRAHEEVMNYVKQNFDRLDQVEIVLSPATNVDEYTEMDNYVVQSVSSEYPRNFHAFIQLTHVSLPTLLPDKTITRIFIACTHFAQTATRLNIFNETAPKSMALYSRHEILGSINLFSLPNWQHSVQSDNRTGVNLSETSTLYPSTKFSISNWYEIQNIRVFLLDEFGNRIKYGTGTTKRPVFTFTIEFFKDEHNKQ